MCHALRLSARAAGLSPHRGWRTNDLWKDGVANIDEHLNGNPYWKLAPDAPGMAYVWPASKHTWALNEVQRFFIEDTRLGVPAEFTDENELLPAWPALATA